MVTPVSRCGEGVIIQVHPPNTHWAPTVGAVIPEGGERPNPPGNCLCPAVEGLPVVNRGVEEMQPCPLYLSTTHHPSPAFLLALGLRDLR